MSLPGVLVLAERPKRCPDHGQLVRDHLVDVIIPEEFATLGEIFLQVAKNLRPELEIDPQGHARA